MRGEYGFNGFIVSDWMDVDRIHDLHHAAPTLKDAFYETIDAGLDMRMHGPDFLEKVVELVKEGRLSEAQIDRACSKILLSVWRRPLKLYLMRSTCRVLLKWRRNLSFC